MAAISSAQTASTFTSPYGDYEQDSWGHVDGYAQDRDHDLTASHPTHYDDGRAPSRTLNGTTNTSGAQLATRRMKSADQLHSAKWDDSHSQETGTLLPAYAPDRTAPLSPTEWRSRSPHKSQDDPSQHEGTSKGPGDDSQWIHRDKLAKIESQELQAAGLFIPRSRAPSKQSRDRSRSNMRRGTATSEPGQGRSRKNSAAVEQTPVGIPSWDLRTPEEIAEEAANAYFTSNGLKGGSRIPVAKTSPAPIPLDYLDRSTPATRNNSESPEGDQQPSMPRSRSASASRGNAGLKGKRSNAELSPKKPPMTTNGRKPSSARNNTQNRPKTRSGSISGGTRPSTRSGESPPTKQPEGDPPWMMNSYKPDPRLPPDQQLLPTVARRLQQERWEKEGNEGSFGDAYDKEFRPLNDTGLLKPPSPTKQLPTEEEPQPTASATGEWPLRPEARSPSIRQGSYSTMPKITDKGATSPLAPPRAPASPLMFQPQIEPQSPAAQRPSDEKEDEGAKKGGCGCCVVM